MIRKQPRASSSSSSSSSSSPPPPLWRILHTAVFAMLLLSGSASSKRDEAQLRYKIQEEIPKGMHICNLIEDARLSYPVDILQLLRFRFLTEPNTLFDIGANTGIITTAAVIDRDSSTLCRQRELCEVSLDVVIQPSQHFQILKVIIEIIDINDNAPKFRESRITLPINEAAAVGSGYIVPTASDTDSPANGVQRYELDSVSNRFGLQINPKLDGTLEVKLVLKAKLDRETESDYQLKLMAYDGGGTLAKTGTLTIDVVVQDSNDNRPEFMRQQYEAMVTENLPIGSTVVKVVAVDQDAGPNGLVGYSFATQTQSLHGQLFGINNLTGEIVVRGVVDHEKSSVYQLIVIAQDHGPDTLSSEVTVIVHVDDLNDNSPSVTFHTLSSSETPVAEILEDSTIGAFVAHISVVDQDSGVNGRVNCTINEKVFSLVQKYSTEYQIVTATMLDRERTDQYFVTLKCQDGGTIPRVAEKTLRVVVLDVNDNAPVFDRQTYTGSLTENNHAGTSVLQVTATDWDEGNNAAVQYSLPQDVATSFYVDQRGVVTANEAIDRETHGGSFSFLVYAVDLGSPPKTGSALVVIDVKDVNDERPSFSQSSFTFSVAENEPPETEVGFLLAEDTDNPPYNNFLFAFASDGGATAEVFSVDPTSGAVRTRKSLDREATGVYRFDVMVYDPNMSSMTDTASVIVNVRDRNDNTPEFVFPNIWNNSVQISSLLPVGHSVTQVQASDADTEENARLSFKVVENRNNNNSFRMDANRVVVASRLPMVDFRVFQVTIQAMDHGNPSRSTSATLYIHVNQSIPFKGFVSGSDEEAAILSSYNLVIVIGIGSGCAIVVFLLVIAIIVVRQRDKRRHIRKYNCRMEALRMLTTKESHVCSSSPETSPRKKKMVNGSKPLICKENNSVAECKAMIPQVTTDNVNGQQTTIDNNQQTTLSKSWHSSKDVEVHPWVHSKTVGTDVDKDSVHSVEGSVTDSGRGPSEEGEAGHIKHNRERYLPPPPPPPRGAYWLQQQKTSTPPSHPTVRFQGLSSTPEEAVDPSDPPGLSTTYQDRTFPRPSLSQHHPYSSSLNSSAASPRYVKTVTMQPHDLHHAPMKPTGCSSRAPVQQQQMMTGNGNRLLPGQQATLDQLSRRKTTLDQLSKLDPASADHYKRSQQQQQQAPTYDRMFSKSKDCVYGQTSTLEKNNSGMVGHDVIV